MSNRHGLTPDELARRFDLERTGCPACGERHPFAGLCPPCREDYEPPHRPTVPTWASGDHEHHAVNRDCGNL